MPPYPFAVRFYEGLNQKMGGLLAERMFMHMTEVPFPADATVTKPMIYMLPDVTFSVHPNHEIQQIVVQIMEISAFSVFPH